MTRYAGRPGTFTSLGLLWLFYLAGCGSAPREDACHPNPCVGLHRSVCIDDLGSAVCFCDSGYVENPEGDCVRPSDTPCEPNPCLAPHKTRCTDVDGLAFCSCDEGFELDTLGNCVADDPCEPNPCTEPHRTNCTADEQGYQCSCETDYLPAETGCLRPCDMPDVCPGENRTRCLNQGTSALCFCDEGTLDDGWNRCLDDPCDPNPCLEPHRSACVANGQDVACECDPGYRLQGNGCVRLESALCSGDGWCRENPSVFGDTIWRVWAHDPDNVFFVGEAGTLLHYDGQDLVALDPGVGLDLYGIWGSSMSDLYVTGDDGLILHFDGVYWHLMDLPPDAPLSQIRAVWGADPQHVYACGDDGLFMFYDGFSWQQIPTGIAVGKLYNLWGTGPFDVWAVGDFGRLVHWDGERLTVEVIADGANLYAIDGPAVDDLYVTTAEGALYHFDGQTWQILTSSPFTLLFSFWSDWQGNFWFVGYDIFASVGLYQRWNAQTGWELLYQESGRGIMGLDGTGPTNLFGGGEVGLAIRDDGEQAARITTGTRRTLWSVGGHADGRTFACGTYGRLVERGPDAWDILDAGYSSLRDIAFDAADQLVMPSTSGRVVTYDGAEFSDVEVGSDETLQALVRLPGGDLLAVGEGGAAARRVADAWSLIDLPTGQNLRAAWPAPDGQIWVVGETGSLLHSDGVDWSTVNLPSNETLNGVFGFGPEDVLAVGDDGTIYHFDGQIWNVESLATLDDLNGVWGAAPDSIFVAGDHGTLLHNNGFGWYRMRSGTRVDLFDVWGDGDGVFAVGDGGTILYRPF